MKICYNSVTPQIAPGQRCMEDRTLPLEFERPGLHPYHVTGVYYLQEPSAMAPVTLLGQQPRECILVCVQPPVGKGPRLSLSWMSGVRSCGPFVQDFAAVSGSSAPGDALLQGKGIVAPPACSDAIARYLQGDILQHAAQGLTII